MVEIGGFHIDPPKKLPKDIQTILDGAKNGVIFFSMGSHVKSSDFSEEKRKIFLNVFKKLDQIVLWKFEDDNLPGKPDNVHIRKWLPQMDLLAHPNIRLFITHGGYGSLQETIYHGVPVLTIPCFADQYNNAYLAVQLGYALKLSYNDKNFNEDTLYDLIQELLNNPQYRENAKTRSRLFHDRPMKPLDTAIYWIEYAIRNKGAPHLKLSTSRHRPPFGRLEAARMAQERPSSSSSSTDSFPPATGSCRRHLAYVAENPSPLSKLKATLPRSSNF
ncbi:UDP-glycosyltransferase UGT5-like [Rhynchophorus ferrugineus]|uniref:UDP-glycosyltransferase UGT5-like n=1 Tax=Rhynchophorus ferrugineus TaxID=354439 RepID=UPI003FCC3211